jgi:hypothetical protein
MNSVRALAPIPPTMMQLLLYNTGEKNYDKKMLKINAF